MGVLTTVEPVGALFRIGSENSGSIDVLVQAAGAVTSVSTPGDLTSLGSGLSAGALTWTQSRRAFWRFAPTGSQAVIVPDGRNVQVGVGGQWWRLTAVPDASWALQTEFNIDPIAGIDDNTGLPGFPIKTADELRLRFDRQFLPQTTTINLLRDVPEYLRLHDLQIGNAALPQRLVIRAPSTAWTTIYTSPAPGITAVTAINRATNQPTVIADANLLLDPAIFVGHRIRIGSVDPARDGATGWVLKKLTATTWRTTPFTVPFDPLTSSGTPGVVTPVAGDTYTIEDVAGILGIDVRCKRLDQQDGAAALSITGLVVDSLDVQKGQTSANAFNDGMVVIDTDLTGAQAMFTRGRLHSLVLSGFRLTVVGSLASLAASNSWNLQSLNGGGALATAGTPSFVACSLRTEQLTILNDWTSQACKVVPTGFVSVNGFGIFDAATGALDLSQPGVGAQASGILYGSGNAGVGVLVPSSKLYQYSAAGQKPTITGSVPGTNDASVGGVNKAWGAIPFTDTAKMCGIVVV